MEVSDWCHRARMINVLYAARQPHRLEALSLEETLAVAAQVVDAPHLHFVAIPLLQHHL